MSSALNVSTTTGYLHNIDHTEVAVEKGGEGLVVEGSAVEGWEAQVKEEVGKVEVEKGAEAEKEEGVAGSELKESSQCSARQKIDIHQTRNSS